MDTWVFDRVRKLFAAATKNSTLDQTLRQDKNVFFLHLLGLDTTGHAYRPYSKEYLQNIKVVDQGVKEMTKLIEDFYGDGKTAFIFTADHGISDWGSHGDGHPDNTRTPLIAWGSGVAKPIISPSGKARGHEDSFSADWGLDQVQRNDVEQADVAALMAYLAGLDYPVNSVGELPLAYLAADLKDKAEAALANARGILEMYRVKEDQKKVNKLRYKAYGPLADGKHSLEYRVAQIRDTIEHGDYQKAVEQSQNLLHIGLHGLKYLQRYDWLFLRVLATTGYLGWIAYAITTVIDMHVLHGKARTSRTFLTSASFVAASATLFSLLLVRRAPLTYYAYAIFPLVFWEEVVARREALTLGGRELFKGVKDYRATLLLGAKAAAFLSILELLVSYISFSPPKRPIPTNSFQVLSYFYRIVYTICYILAASWPLFYGQNFILRRKSLVATWTVASLSMSTFTLLPAIKVEDINVM